MPITELNHVTVRAADMEATRDFYSEVLGLVVGPRPDLGFPGYWLYAGTQPVIHLVPPGNGIGGGASDDTGSFDHVAFLGKDYDGTRRHLDGLGLSYRQNDVPSANLRQLFLVDPNRVMIELNFQAA